MAVTIAYVHPSNVGATWPHIKDFVVKVCEESGGRRTPAKVLAQLITNLASLWVAHTEEMKIIAFATTRFIDYDDVKLMGIELVGGEDLDEWLEDGQRIMAKFAMENGCDGLEGYGRGAAWARKLKHHGWTPCSTMIELRWD